MCPSILGGVGEGAHLHHPQNVSLCLGWWWGRGSLASSTECVPLSILGGGPLSILGGGPLSWVVVGEGLICIIHRMCPSILGGGGGGARLHHPQSMSLSLSWVEVGEGLTCIIHRMCPSILGGGGGGAHLHHLQSMSLYLGWWLICIINSVSPSYIPWVKVCEGEVHTCIVHTVCPSGRDWGGAHLLCSAKGLRGGGRGGVFCIIHHHK